MEMVSATLLTVRTLKKYYIETLKNGVFKRGIYVSKEAIIAFRIAAFISSTPPCPSSYPLKSLQNNVMSSLNSQLSHYSPHEIIPRPHYIFSFGLGAIDVTTKLGGGGGGGIMRKPPTPKGYQTHRFRQVLADNSPGISSRDGE